MKDIKKEALDKCADYLAKYSKTEREIERYLIKKGYTQDIIAYCIDKLKGYNYLDDSEYCRLFIGSKIRTTGKRMIEQKLLIKGVDKQTIKENLASYDDSQAAVAVLAKYMKNKQPAKEVLQKAYRHLISRGFSYDTASETLSAFRDQLTADN